MPDFDDDFPDAEWTGRPQDDPKLLAMLAAGRAEFRRKHPPVNCWIDSVETIELYLGGVMRAKVERGRSVIAYFDDQGHAVSTAIYLRSENPYDVVEAHLGIDRVEEIRDESNDAEEPISSYLREREEREAAAFSSRYYREDEIFLYLRSAVGALKDEADVGGLHRLVVHPLLEAITAAVLDQYEVALTQVQGAADELERREPAMMFSRPALAGCRRAIVAVERHIAIQGQRPVRRSETGGKSGG